MTLSSRAGAPSLITALLSARVLSSSDVDRLGRQAGVLTRADLGQALDDGRVARHLGAALAQQLARYDQTTQASTIPLGRALDIVDSLRAELAAAAPGLPPFEPAGDIRRVDPLVADIVLVARAENPAAVIDALAGAVPATSTILHRSARRVLLDYRQAEVDIRVAAPDDYGTVLFAATGSRAHYRGMLARRTRPALHAREEQLYADAGLAWIAPELREGRGEIEAAASARLPRLLERHHIRGDLHVHSTYSDGRDTLAAMAQAATDAGYEYIAFTDHSENAAASRTLAARDVLRQRDEIAALRQQFAPLQILHGVEVDILPSGRLDFPDRVLEGFDIVLASLHERVGHDGARLTRRCLEAIRHPLVNVITHPANRPVGRRDGYPLDYDAIFAAAAETGTALEVDGAPGHLDLDGELARAAARAGALLTVDSDCHRASALERQIQLGVSTARRGWIEPTQVLNTRPVEAVMAFVGAKRAGKG